MELNGAKILYTIHTNIPVLGDFKITQTLVSTWIVMALLSALAFWLGRDLKLENVSKRQAAAEFIVERLDQFVHDNMGWHFDQFIPLVGAIFALSIGCNLISVVGLWSPTADLNTEAAWAIVVFVLIMYYKIKTNGILSYLKGLLDPIFIMPWGLNMGAAGAGLATFLSNCFACLYFMVLLFVKRGRTYVCIDPRKLSFESSIVGGVCMVGIPAAIQNLLNVTGMTILNNFTSSYGANAVAAMGIAQKINQVPFYIANGLSQGIMPLISYNYASDNIKRMKHTLTFAAKISVTGLVLVSIAYSFFAGDLITMFMDNPEIVEMGSRFLRGFCLGLPFLCVDFLAVGVFQASGLGRNALVFAILRKIVLEIPALFILNHFFPLYGLAYAQFTAELVLSIAAVIILVKLFGKLELEKADRDAQKAQKA